MAAKKRKASKNVKNPPAKRQPRARISDKQDDPVWSTTNPNSSLVYEDLHAKYSDPATYANWTKEDWEEVHQFLPEDVRFNDDGYSVDISFFKYDPDWRRLIREFQEDLGAGRYEPEWLQAAAQAMEERARGDFDQFKEDQFEEFWGQKQRHHSEWRAGDASKVRFGDLVQTGLFRVGDEFFYRRTFGRKNSWMIEKEIKIIGIKDDMLTLAIPSGQLIFAIVTHLQQDSKADSMMSAGNATVNVVNKASDESRSDVPSIDANSVDAATPSPTSNPRHTQLLTPECPTEGGQPPSEAPESGNPIKLASTDLYEETSRPSNWGNMRVESAYQDSTQDANIAIVAEDVQENEQQTIKDLGKISSLVVDSGKDDTHNHQKPDQADTPATAGHNELAQDICSRRTEVSSSRQKPMPPVEADGTIHITTKLLSELEQAIINTDGRISWKDAPAHSAWRAIRVKRNNQDMGSLFDMREQHFLDMNTKPVKALPRSSEQGKQPDKLIPNGAPDALNVQVEVHHTTIDEEDRNETSSASKVNDGAVVHEVPERFAKRSKQAGDDRGDHRGDRRGFDQPRKSARAARKKKL